jgi:hypothetical protein
MQMIFEGNGLMDQKAIEAKLTGINNAKEFGRPPNGPVGNSDSIQAMIDNCRNNTIAKGDLSNQYTILLESGKYIIDKTIKMSPFIKLKPIGQVEFCVTHNGTGLWITPDAADPKFGYSTNQSIHLYKNSWMRGEFIDGSNGALIFSTTINRDAATTKTIAIEIGSRDQKMSEATPIARYVISHVSAFGFDIGLKLNSIQHFIGTFKHLFFELNNHHVVWGDSNVPLINSNENFTFDNCIFAQAKKQSFIMHKGIDITIENTSFDFNASPIFNSKESGVCLRLSNCYVEMIGNGFTDEQLLYKAEATHPDGRYGRNSLYFDGLVLFLNRPKLLIDNIPNPSNKGVISMYVNISGMEVRLKETAKAIPYADIELIDTTKGILVFAKNNLHLMSNRTILSKNFNTLGNSDFSMSKVGAITSTSDQYWNAVVNNCKATFGKNGVAASTSLDVAVTNTTTNYLDLTYKFKHRVTAGQIVTLNPSIKIANTTSKLTIMTALSCYDDANNLVDTLIYYNVLTTATTAESFNNYMYPRILSEFRLPKGTTSIVPKIVISQANMNYSINDVQLMILGD